MQLELNPKQAEFTEAVFSGHYKYLMYGGAIRGGKTVAAIAIVLMLARIFPGSRWAIVRKDLPTIKRNTVPSFNKFAPPGFCLPVNRTDWFVDCVNGSRIIFFPESFDVDRELNRWRGLEVNGFVLEEANELNEAGFEKAIERAGTWICTECIQPPPLIMATCNPSKGYVSRLFYEPWSKGLLTAPWYYIPAKITDNPHAATPEYMASLAELKKINEKMYRRFVDGDWTVSDDPDQLIKYEWINAARNVEPIPGKNALGVDVARYGDDKTVLCYRNGNTVTALDYHDGLSTERVAAYVREAMIDGPIDAPAVKVDGVGIGAGVIDSLESQGYHVTDIISGAGADASGPYQFNNLRSQLWWNSRENLRQGLVCLDVDDNRLVEDLTAPRYTITSDKMIKVESKDEIKKRIGRSTDAGDAYVYSEAPENPNLGELSVSGAGTRRSPWE
jgi:hypothetical protein